MKAALRDVTVRYGATHAVRSVTLGVPAGRVTCLLGDNGAGKSTLIRVMSGSLPPTEGSFEIDGRAVQFRSPADARAAGICTVYQDLALAPLMSVWRNFFLGAEPTTGRSIFRRIDVASARRIALDETARLGVMLPDAESAAGSLSGGERQCVAIARAVYFGARLLILDEPTAALGVRQVEIVLKTIAEVRARGVTIVLVTHNPQHAFDVGDDFVILRRGQVAHNATREQVTPAQLQAWMAETDDRG